MAVYTSLLGKWSCQQSVLEQATLFQWPYNAHPVNVPRQTDLLKQPGQIHRLRQIDNGASVIFPRNSLFLLFSSGDNGAATWRKLQLAVWCCGLHWEKSGTLTSFEMDSKSCQRPRFSLFNHNY